MTKTSYRRTVKLIGALSAVVVAACAHTTAPKTSPATVVGENVRRLN